MTRSFSSRLQRCLQHHRHTCARVACLHGCRGSAKPFSRRPSCDARGQSILLLPSLLRSSPPFKTHSTTVPKRLPSSRCIENAPAIGSSLHPDACIRRSVSDTALRLPVLNLVNFLEHFFADGTQGYLSVSASPNVRVGMPLRHADLPDPSQESTMLRRERPAKARECQLR